MPRPLYRVSPKKFHSWESGKLGTSYRKTQHLLELNTYSAISEPAWRNWTFVSNEPLSGINYRVNKVTTSFDNCICTGCLKKCPTLGNPVVGHFLLGNTSSVSPETSAQRGLMNVLH